MLETNRFSRAILAGLFSLLVAVSACDKTGQDTTDAEIQAGRDTADAMSREHAGDSASPSEAATTEPSQAVDFKTLAYAEVDDELVYGYLAYPSGMTEPLPAIIMIHEWWGLNDNIRAMAKRLAAEGYMVLAVDLYGGETAANAGAARVKMLEVVENSELAEENLRQAVEFLKTTGAPAIASLGWCFGGGWSLNSAMLFPEELDATVIYYGQVTNDDEKLRVIDSPLLGFFGGADRGISLDSVNAFKAALQRLRIDNEIHIYPEVGHAFANPSGNNYNREAAEDAWSRTLQFLARNLSQSD